MGTKLTTPEAKRLAECEAIIHQGLDGWVDVTHALLDIRDNDLWIGKGKTFGAYCKAEFGISRSRVYQLIESCNAVDAVSTIVDCPTPRNEAVARELSKVKTEQEQADLWTAANKTAPKDKKTGEPIVTAAHVAKTRRADLGWSIPEPAPLEEERDDFQVELDDASDVFRLLAEQDQEAVLMRLAVLRLEFEGEGDMGV